MSTKLSRFLVGFIFLLALLIRLRGIQYGLPYIYHPDEPNTVGISIHFLKSGDLNPHFFSKPALLYYANAILFRSLIGLGLTSENIGSLASMEGPEVLTMGVAYANNPEFYLAGRALTALAGALVVIVTYTIGKKINGNPGPGLLAAFFVAVSTTSTANSRYIEVDTYLVLFIQLALFFSILIYQQGRMRDYLLAGISTGLAIAFKYPAALVVLTLLAAHIIREWRSKPLRNIKIYLALLIIPVVFLITNPYVVLDFPAFINDTFIEVNHYSSGHPGFEGDTFRWFLTYLWNYEGAITLLGVFGMVDQVRRKDPDSALLILFTIVYFTFFSLFRVRFDRTLLPILPPLFVLGSIFIFNAFTALGAIEKRNPHYLSQISLALIVGLIAIRPARYSIQLANTLATVDNRKTARAWIAENIPEQSKLAIEAYAPFVDPSTYQVTAMKQLTYQSPEWFVVNDYDYLIFSERMYGRFFQAPELYQTEIDQYNAFFDRFTLMQRFPEGYAKIRIYEIDE